MNRGIRFIAALVLVAIVAAPAAVHAQNGAAVLDQRLERAQRLYEEGLAAAKARQFAQAIPLYEEALHLRQETLGRTHVELAPILKELATAHRRERSDGGVEAALAHLQRRVQILEASRDHEPELAQALEDLAGVQRARRDYDEAMRLLDRSLALRQKLSTGDQDLGATYVSFARTYEQTGDYAQARALYERAASFREKTPGPQNQNLIQSLTALARFYERIGDYNLALDTHERSLALRKQRLGPHHPELAHSLNALIEVSRRLGDLDRAQDYVEQSNALTAAPGLERAMAVRLNNQARLLEHKRDFPKALKLYEESLRTAQRELGPNHRYVGVVLTNLARLHRQMNQDAKALPLIEQSIDVLTKSQARETDVAAALETLARVQRSMNDPAKALPHLQRAVAIRVKLQPDHPDLAEALINLGRLHEDLGHWEQAREQHLRALAIRERVPGPQQQHLAQSLSSLGRFYEKWGDYDQAVQTHQRALEVREAHLAAGHRDIGRSLAQLASVHRLMGEYDTAQSYQERSIAIDAVHGSERSRAWRMHSQALLYLEQRDPARALPLLEKAVESLIAESGENHRGVGMMLGNLARAYRGVGERAKAVETVERSLTILVKMRPESPEVARAYDTKAGMYRGAGDYAKALELYGRSLEIRRRIKTDHQDVAESLANIGGVHRAKGEYSRALAYYRDSREIREMALRHGHPSIAQDLAREAKLYDLMGDHAQALVLQERSLAIQEKVFGPEHANTARSLARLARLHAVMGQDEKAMQRLRRSLAIVEQKSEPRLLAWQLATQAFVFQTLAGRVDAEEALQLRHQAVGFLQESIKLRQQVLRGQEHPSLATAFADLAAALEATGAHENAFELRTRALALAIQSNRPEILWRVYDGMRSSLSYQRKWDLAIFFGKQAVNTIQAMRSNHADMDEDLQRTFLDNKMHAYRALANLLIDNDRLPEAQHVSAMFKDEEYLDYIRRDGAQSAGQAQVPMTSRAEHQSHADLTGIQQAHASASNPATTGGSAPRQTERGPTARQAIVQFLDRAMAEKPTPEENKRLAEFRKDMDPLQRVLVKLERFGHGAAGVYYFVGEDKLRIVLTTPKAHFGRESQITRQELNRKIEQFHSALTSPGKDPLPLARELYGYLIAPIADLLKEQDARTLMLGLDGTLRYLPFGALHDGSRYLVQDFRLAIHTRHNDQLADEPQSEWRVAGLGLTQAHEVGGRKFTALPSVRQELEGIVRTGERGILPGTVRFDKEFTAETMAQAVQQKYPVLHIASHFVFQPGTETNSFLLLGDGKPFTLRDFREGDEMDLAGVDLLTLSACQTAVGGGQDHNGFEVEGFGTLAQERGAKGVIATLWRVADDSTGLLMQHVYRLRHETPGMTKAEALRQAQLLFISGKIQAAGSAAVTRAGGRDADPAGEAKPAGPTGYTHPFHWAPFILMGNWL